MQRRAWTTVEVSRLRALYPDMENGAIGAVLGRTWSAVQNMAVKLGLHKSPQFLAGPFCRFQRGHETWNKGRAFNPDNHSTRFKKGHRGPRQKPIGSVRIGSDGVMIKVAEPRVWRPLARVLWEKHVGPIPAGMVVRLKDGNQHNCVPQNLILMSRADNARLIARHPGRPARRATNWAGPIFQAVA
jgi:HNH endonuclease